MTPSLMNMTRFATSLANPISCVTTTMVNHLMSWIRRNPVLTEELTRLGYRKSAKYFTPKEVGKIVEYLGEP